MDEAEPSHQITAPKDNTMPHPDCSPLVAQQREFFLSGSTRPVAWRKAQLEALKARVIQRTAPIGG
jgi:hypothetical protein